MIAIFTLAHGVLIPLRVFLFEVSGPVPANDIRAATMWGADAEGKSAEQIQADYAAEMKAERGF